MSTNYLVTNALHIVNSADSHLDRNELATGIANSGIRISGSSGSLVRDNTFERVEAYLLFSSGSTDLLISDNRLRGAVTGIELGSATNSIIEGNTIDQIANTGDGLRLVGSNNVYVNQNTIAIPRYGIRTDTSTGTIVLRNAITFKRGLPSSTTPGFAYYVNGANAALDASNTSTPID
jgi:nitrous oxidase accessory protein NosD